MSRLWVRSLIGSTCLLSLAAPTAALESSTSTGVDQTLLLVIVPLLAIQIVLLAWALYDLTRPGRRVKGDSRILWAIVVIVIGVLGPLAYFLFGREEA